MIRVVIADGHPVVRIGARQLLESAPGICVIGEAETGVDALQLVGELGPDVLLLDATMPDMSGVEVARKLKAANSPVQILTLSVHDDRQHVMGMLQTGVAGYLTKDEAPERICQAVRGVARGEKGWLSQQLAKRIYFWSSDGPRTEPTDREKEVLQLVVAGKTNQAIAAALGITEKTVEKHMTSVFSKFQIGSRVEAAILTVREGWASP
jgi:DNA-binding NarL/FixJ family response regulator